MALDSDMSSLSWPLYPRHSIKNKILLCMHRQRQHIRLVPISFDKFLFKFLVIVTMKNEGSPLIASAMLRWVNSF